jgi:carboxypeptidase T
MELILKVTPTEPRAPLAHIVGLHLGLDVWEINPDHAVLLATAEQAERLRRVGYGIEQLNRTEQYVASFTAVAVAAAPGATLAFHSVASLEQDLRQLADSRPEIAELQEIGRSVENRPIWALRIGERRGSTRKLLFMGCHHAREWISVEVPYLLADHLVKHADEAPVKRWLSRGEIWVAPMINPDGHEFSRAQDRLWRKNRRPNADGTIGVDLNRNYGYMWGTLNANTVSHVPSDPTYIGPRAFSEPETQAVRDLVTRERFRGLITYHSYSQLILYPWGYTTDRISDDADLRQMTRRANRMRQLVRGVNDKEYTAKQSSQLYPTAGDTTDWAYGTFGIPSFTVELRPQTLFQGAFILAPDEIQPTWEENLPAITEFIQRTL